MSQVLRNLRPVPLSSCSSHWIRLVLSFALLFGLIALTLSTLYERSNEDIYGEPRREFSTEKGNRDDCSGSTVK